MIGLIGDRNLFPAGGLKFYKFNIIAVCSNISLSSYLADLDIDASLDVGVIKFFYTWGDGIAQRKLSRFPPSRPGFDSRPRLVSGRQKKDNEIKPKKPRFSIL